MNFPKLKVVTVVGTRPEVIRLSRVLARLDEAVEHTLVHTGQNYDYELNQIFFDEMGLRLPDIVLQLKSQTPAGAIGEILTQVDGVFEKMAPDAVLVLGDTNSCLSVISAKRRKIPIFHMEAGNRCFDTRVPEEINRKIVDHIADINLPYSDIAREYLLREGIAPDRIITTGSPMHEVLEFYRSQIEGSRVVDQLGLEPQKYFVVSCHREENVDAIERLVKVADILNALAERYGLRIIVSTHPRTRKRLETAKIDLHPLVELMRPLGFFDYVKLQMESLAVLSDSGTISEESSLLGFSALNIRDAHERPEAMEEASVMMTGLDVERVMQALDIELSLVGSKRQVVGAVKNYAVPNVAEKVVRIILSYTDYVNRVVWQAGV